MFRWLGRKKEPAGRLFVTAAAHARLLELLQREGAAAVRVIARGPGAFDMALEASVGSEDVVIDVDGARFVVDADSLAAVNGATVDFEADPLRPGFRIDPPIPGDDPELGAQVRAVIEQQINPGVAAHGGVVQLVGIKEDVVYVSMGGGCQGCSMASVTLSQGIEQMIKQAVPRVRAVVDATDHAGGTNPFYAAAKGGESPFHQAAKA